MDLNPAFMARALQLARNGLGHVSPNPMVGAVIVRGGRIIGEGWHRRYGEGHAEVNAVASVADRALLRDSTMYVTLEPCSHYGKTPPCARLIIECGIPRVVVATLDPFEKVSGRGVAMLREAGVEVHVGLMEREARELNRVFFTAHTLRRPFVMLKWAQSADGYLDRDRTPVEAAERFSTPLTSLAVHRLRSQFDAIMVGSGTVIMDNPRLDVRLLDPGARAPRPVVLDRRGRVSPDARVFSSGSAIYVGPERPDINARRLPPADTLPELLDQLYSLGITSLLVEGGRRLLDAFIAGHLWDQCRIEVTPRPLHPTPARLAPISIPSGILLPPQPATPNTILTILPNS